MEKLFGTFPKILKYLKNAGVHRSLALHAGMTIVLTAIAGVVFGTAAAVAALTRGLRRCGRSGLVRIGFSEVRSLARKKWDESDRKRSIHLPAKWQSRMPDKWRANLPFFVAQQSAGEEEQSGGKTAAS